MVSRLTRWPQWRQSWIGEQNNFSNSVSLCRSNASHQVSAQSNLLFRRDVVRRISRWQPWRPSWISERKDFSNSESLCHSDASHQVSAQSDLFWEEMSFEEIQDGGHLGYRNRTTLAILNLYVALMHPTKFLLNLTNGLGGDVTWRISRWLPILDIRTEWF